MSKGAAGSVISLRSVRQNNLKNFDLDLPAGRLIVVTGLSGSGKSSLAFDTLYAEGQRRYIETFSPYARQFLDRMDKPRVDSIQGIPPAIAIEQRNAVRSTRSTVGTMTEICDYMKVVWSHLAPLHCRGCGRPVRKDSPRAIWEELIRDGADGSEMLVAFELKLSDKLSLPESLALVSKQGYQRLLIGGTENGSRPVAAPEVVRIEDAAERFAATGAGGSLRVVQDRIRLVPASRSRFSEACEQAYHFGKGKLEVYGLDRPWRRRFSNRFHCAECDQEYAAPTPALFSFNHPVGACPTCRGFGRTITIEYKLAIPDPSLTLAQGVVKPWQSGVSAECQRDLMQFCRKRKAPVDVPFEQLSPDWQRWVIDGDRDYGKDAQHEWPHAWYGIKGYFRWLESKAYKMHVRVLLSRYRAYRPCPDCAGQRFQPDALLYKMTAPDGRILTLADFYLMPVTGALTFAREIRAQHANAGNNDPIKLVLDEVCSRLGYLEEAGLGYLTLDRPTRSLSGGETERVNLTTCLGSRLVNTLFVLDEPTVGLHARDTQRLVRILERLRDSGNTVVVVEHDPAVMRAADQLVDLGPGHGETGGQLVFQGRYEEILKSTGSLTGQFLSGKEQIPIPPRRPVVGAVEGAGRSPETGSWLRIRHARRFNLKDLAVDVPLGRFVCVTGVSGSGKTTLVREVLLPSLTAKLKSSPRQPRDPQEDPEPEAVDTDTLPETENATGNEPAISGWEALGRVVLMDQSPLGRTPRSNPAVYIGAFEHIRELFARSELARQHGLKSSAFSFNSSQGRCEMCGGAGFEKIEMQFLSDVFVRCAACRGRRYRQHILDIRIAPEPAERGKKTRAGVEASRGPRGAQSIADLLDATLEEAIEFLHRFRNSRPAARAAERLSLLQDVGLGYLRLGQPINTLSGGESQRLKLAAHLAAWATAEQSENKPTLFVFDEPTTGLHFADVRVLLGVFQRLVEQGHSVLVVEHNLDLIKSADWIIDLGPEAGDAGGQLVAEGAPEAIAANPRSYTGQSLLGIGIPPAPPKRN